MNLLQAGVKLCAYDISKDIICNSAHVSLQTSLSFLRSQPPWRFRSFAMMSLISQFLPFPTNTKKTPAASLTFNLSSWSRKQCRRWKHYATKHTFWITKGEIEERNQRQLPQPLNTDGNRMTRLWHIWQKRRCRADGGPMWQRGRQLLVLTSVLKRSVAGSYSHRQIWFKSSSRGRKCKSLGAESLNLSSVKGHWSSNEWQLSRWVLCIGGTSQRQTTSSVDAMYLSM